MEKMSLYEYWRSSCSWRVRWALNIKNIPYQSHHIDLLKKEHLSQEYMKKNPSGLVPCLMTAYGPVSESIAILEWLEEIKPTPSLLPSDPYSRLLVRQLVQKIASGTQPVQNLSVQARVSSDPQERQNWAYYWIEKGLGSYEALLRNLSLNGTFSMGGEVTMADLCLIPQCYNAERFGVDLSLFPIINGIYRRTLKTKACSKAHPSNHPFSVHV